MTYRTPPYWTEPRPRNGLGRALGLTVASTMVWGVAHLSAGRRGTGAALMTLFAALIGGAATLALGFREDVERVAVRPQQLDGVIAAIVVLALTWAAVVVRSYQVVRPRRISAGGQAAAAMAVAILVAAVCAPLGLAARDAYALRGTISGIFQDDPALAGAELNKPRVNILLMGGDGAANRQGIRPDSMTVASIDTATGDTVLLGLPRNLQRFAVPPRLRPRWPDGFTGTAPGAEGLLNEMYQAAENDPSLVPGVPAGRRGPRLMREQISFLLGQPVDFYVLVNLFGFRDIVDAVGGVRLRVQRDIPFGGPSDGSRPSGVIRAGTRELDGTQALWYARARQGSSDFARMGRQKCLMKALADQADPRRVLTNVGRLADATKKTITTDIPARLLPALVELSGKVKRGAEVRSLQFVPPRVQVFRPDVRRIRQLAAQALSKSEGPGRPSSPVRRAQARTNRNQPDPLDTACA
ncbi:LCP family protein [Actinomadura graeca]|uniref:LCP family protein n=1 Tax=Actinomadura graeca TaxID=2750812 RepID=A0ABX8R3S9_9ACTN|nr:LCP family protein [Actinomadura graeca]QXJ25726.1 LCP family protein [Actinomadura graeca]